MKKYRWCVFSFKTNGQNEMELYLAACLKNHKGFVVETKKKLST